MNARAVRLCFLVWGVLVLPAYLHAESANLRWRRIAEGLEFVRFDVKPGALFSTEMSAIRVDQMRYRLAVLRAQDFGARSSSVKNVCLKSRAAVCINASFFDEQGRPLGLVISHSSLLNPMHNSGRTLTGVLQIRRDAVSIVHRGAFLAQGVVEAVQAGPRLLSKGEAVPSYQTEVSRRSGVCLDQSGHLILFVVSSTFNGLSIPELQELLKGDLFACQDALNFDGGSSAQLYVSGELRGAASDAQEISVPGRDEVPIMLGLFGR